MEPELAGCCSSTDVPKHGSAQGPRVSQRAGMPFWRVSQPGMATPAPGTDRRMQEGWETGGWSEQLSAAHLRGDAGWAQIPVKFFHPQQSLDRLSLPSCRAGCALGLESQTAAGSSHPKEELSGATHHQWPSGICAASDLQALCNWRLPAAVSTNWKYLFVFEWDAPAQPCCHPSLLAAALGSHLASLCFYHLATPPKPREITGRWRKLQFLSQWWHRRALSCPLRKRLTQIISGVLNSKWGLVLTHHSPPDFRGITGESVLLSMFCQIKLWRTISIVWMEIHSFLPSGNLILCLIDRKILSVNYINV